MTPLTLQEREKVLALLAPQLDANVFSTWCRDLEFQRVDDASVRVPMANPYQRDWLEKLLRKPLEDALRRLFGHEVRLEFCIDADAPVPPPPPVFAPPRRPAEAAPVLGVILNPAYTFANFIEGPSNRMALAAARAVSENPATLYNPLFIHGGVGLGKTHLLQAICNAVLARNPAAKVIYMSCEDFVNSFIDSLNKNRLDAFRARYRNADLLVVDDIHFLAGKEKSEEEFLHTFNALHLAGRQVVLSSDQPARDIRKLKQHLLSRFSSGFDASVTAPTYETRLSILRSKAGARGWDVPQDVLGYIATVMEGNIRQLDGNLTKVWGYASLTGQPLSVDVAKEVLREEGTPRAVNISIPEIQQAVARYYNKRLSDLQSRRWTKSTSLARQVCIYLCRQFVPLSLKELGGFFGGKDHTTILYSIRKVTKLMQKDPHIKSDVERLSREIKSKMS